MLELPAMQMDRASTFRYSMMKTVSSPMKICHLQLFLAMRILQKPLLVPSTHNVFPAEIMNLISMNSWQLKKLTWHLLNYVPHKMMAMAMTMTTAKLMQLVYKHTKINNTTRINNNKAITKITNKAITKMAKREMRWLPLSYLSALCFTRCLQSATKTSSPTRCTTKKATMLMVCTLLPTLSKCTFLNNKRISLRRFAEWLRVSTLVLTRRTVPSS
mmetsp:Transcript_4229/g.5569  ORF Transcript_4229/g.5569 Transcript_4229/m.5569 type:complete len:216 (-) Transcript_4229:403-1050(-)